jgi:neutral trehalase
MYGNARAIAKIARLNGDTAVAEDFEARAETLRQGILDTLWDDERSFFYHMQRLAILDCTLRMSHALILGFLTQVGQSHE